MIPKGRLRCSAINDIKIAANFLIGRNRDRELESAVVVPVFGLGLAGVRCRGLIGAERLPVGGKT